MDKDNIGIEYTMKQLKCGGYILVDNETGREVCTGTEEQIRELFIEQNEREYNRIANRTYKESQNRLKAEAIIDGGECVFREISLGKCYFAIMKMIENQQVTQEQGINFMKILELYAFNTETPLAAEEGQEYYKKYKEHLI